MYKFICANITKSRNFTNSYKKLAQNKKYHLDGSSSATTSHQECFDEKNEENQEQNEEDIGANQEQARPSTSPVSGTIQLPTKIRGTRSATSTPTLKMKDYPKFYAGNYLTVEPPTPSISKKYYHVYSITPAPAKRFSSNINYRKVVFNDKFRENYKRAMQVVNKLQKERRVFQWKPVVNNPNKPAHTVSDIWAQKYKKKSKPDIRYPTHTIKHNLKLSQRFRIREGSADRKVKELEEKFQQRKKAQSKVFKNLNSKKIKYPALVESFKRKGKLNSVSAHSEQDRKKIEENDAGESEKPVIKILKIPKDPSMSPQEFPDVCYVNNTEPKEESDLSHQLDKIEQDFESLIKSHPTVQNASKEVKRKLKTKFVQLLFKPKQSRPSEEVEATEELEEKPNYENEQVEEKLADGVEYPEDFQEKVTNDANEETKEEIKTHPTTMTSEKIREKEYMVARYPKRVWMDTTNNYDIDKVCIKDTATKSGSGFIQRGSSEKPKLNYSNLEKEVEELSNFVKVQSSKRNSEETIKKLKRKKVTASSTAAKLEELKKERLKLMKELEKISKIKAAQEARIKDNKRKTTTDGLEPLDSQSEPIQTVNAICKDTYKSDKLKNIMRKHWVQDEPVLVKEKVYDQTQHKSKSVESATNDTPEIPIHGNRRGQFRNLVQDEPVLVKEKVYDQTQHKSMSVESATNDTPEIAIHGNRRGQIRKKREDMQSRKLKATMKIQEVQDRTDEWNKVTRNRKFAEKIRKLNDEILNRQPKRVVEDLEEQMGENGITLRSHESKELNKLHLETNVNKESLDTDKAKMLYKIPVRKEQIAQMNETEYDNVLPDKEEVEYSTVLKKVTEKADKPDEMMDNMETKMDIDPNMNHKATSSEVPDSNSVNIETLEDQHPIKTNQSCMEGLSEIQTNPQTESDRKKNEENSSLLPMKADVEEDIEADKEEDKPNEKVNLGATIGRKEILEDPEKLEILNEIAQRIANASAKCKMEMDAKVREREEEERSVEEEIENKNDIILSERSRSRHNLVIPERLQRQLPDQDNRVIKKVRAEERNIPENQSQDNEFNEIRGDAVQIQDTRALKHSLANLREHAIEENPDKKVLEESFPIAHLDENKYRQIGNPSPEKANKESEEELKLESLDDLTMMDKLNEIARKTENAAIKKRLKDEDRKKYEELKQKQNPLPAKIVNPKIDKVVNHMNEKVEIGEKAKEIIEQISPEKKTTVIIKNIPQKTLSPKNDDATKERPFNEATKCDAINRDTQKLSSKKNKTPKFLIKREPIKKYLKRNPSALESKTLKEYDVKTKQDQKTKQSLDTFHRKKQKEWSLVKKPILDNIKLAYKASEIKTIKPQATQNDKFNLPSKNEKIDLKTVPNSRNTSNNNESKCSEAKEPEHVARAIDIKTNQLLDANYKINLLKNKKSDTRTAHNSSNTKKDHAKYEEEKQSENTKHANEIKTMQPLNTQNDTVKVFSKKKKDNKATGHNYRNIYRDVAKYGEQKQNAKHSNDIKTIQPLNTKNYKINLFSKNKKNTEETGHNSREEKQSENAKHANDIKTMQPLNTQNDKVKVFSKKKKDNKATDHNYSNTYRDAAKYGEQKQNPKHANDIKTIPPLNKKNGKMNLFSKSEKNNEETGHNSREEKQLENAKHANDIKTIQSVNKQNDKVNFLSKNKTIKEEVSQDFSNTYKDESKYGEQKQSENDKHVNDIKTVQPLNTQNNKMNMKHDKINDETGHNSSNTEKDESKFVEEKRSENVKNAVDTKTIQSFDATNLSSKNKKVDVDTARNSNNTNNNETKRSETENITGERMEIENYAIKKFKEEALKNINAAREFKEMVLHKFFEEIALPCSQQSLYLPKPALVVRDMMEIDDNRSVFEGNELGNQPSDKDSPDKAVLTTGDEFVIFKNNLDNPTTSLQGQKKESDSVPIDESQSTPKPPSNRTGKSAGKSEGTDLEIKPMDQATKLNKELSQQSNIPREDVSNIDEMIKRIRDLEKMLIEQKKTKLGDAQFGNKARVPPPPQKPPADHDKKDHKKDKPKGPKDMVLPPKVRGSDPKPPENNPKEFTGKELSETGRESQSVNELNLIRDGHFSKKLKFEEKMEEPDWKTTKIILKPNALRKTSPDKFEKAISNFIKEEGLDQIQDKTDVGKKESSERVPKDKSTNSQDQDKTEKDTISVNVFNATNNTAGKKKSKENLTSTRDRKVRSSVINTVQKGDAKDTLSTKAKPSEADKIGNTLSQVKFQSPKTVTGQRSITTVKKIVKTPSLTLTREGFEKWANDNTLRKIRSFNKGLKERAQEKRIKVTKSNIIVRVVPPRTVSCPPPIIQQQKFSKIEEDKTIALDQVAPRAASCPPKSTQRGKQYLGLSSEAKPVQTVSCSSVNNQSLQQLIRESNKSSTYVSMQGSKIVVKSIKQRPVSCPSRAIPQPQNFNREKEHAKLVEDKKCIRCASCSPKPSRLGLQESKTKYSSWSSRAISCPGTQSVQKETRAETNKPSTCAEKSDSEKKPTKSSSFSGSASGANSNVEGNDSGPKQNKLSASSFSKQDTSVNKGCHKCPPMCCADKNLKDDKSICILTVFLPKPQDCPKLYSGSVSPIGEKKSVHKIKVNGYSSETKLMCGSQSITYGFKMDPAQIKKGISKAGISTTPKLREIDDKFFKKKPRSIDRTVKEISDNKPKEKPKEKTAIFRINYDGEVTIIKKADENIETDLIDKTPEISTSRDVAKTGKQYSDDLDMNRKQMDANTRLKESVAKIVTDSASKTVSKDKTDETQYLNNKQDTEQKLVAKIEQIIVKPSKKNEDGLKKEVHKKPNTFKPKKDIYMTKGIKMEEIFEKGSGKTNIRGYEEVPKFENVFIKKSTEEASSPDMIQKDIKKEKSQHSLDTKPVDMFKNTSEANILKWASPNYKNIENEIQKKYNTFTKGDQANGDIQQLKPSSNNSPNVSEKGSKIQEKINSANNIIPNDFVKANPIKNDNKIAKLSSQDRLEFDSKKVAAKDNKDQEEDRGLLEFAKLDNIYVKKKSFSDLPDEAKHKDLLKFTKIDNIYVKKTSPRDLSNSRNKPSKALSEQSNNKLNFDTNNNTGGEEKSSIKHKNVVDVTKTETILVKQSTEAQKDLNQKSKSLSNNASKLTIKRTKVQRPSQHHKYVPKSDAKNALKEGKKVRANHTILPKYIRDKKSAGNTTENNKESFEGNEEMDSLKNKGYKKVGKIYIKRKYTDGSNLKSEDVVKLKDVTGRQSANEEPESITNALNASKVDNKIGRNEKSKAADVLSKTDDITKTDSLKSNSMINLNTAKLFNKFDSVQKDRKSELKSSRSDILRDKTSVPKVALRGTKEIETNFSKNLDTEPNKKDENAKTVLISNSNKYFINIPSDLNNTNSIQKGQKIDLNPIKSNNIKDNTIFNEINIGVIKPVSTATDKANSVQKHLKGKVDPAKSETLSVKTSIVNEITVNIIKSKPADDSSTRNDITKLPSNKIVKTIANRPGKEMTQEKNKADENNLKADSKNITVEKKTDKYNKSTCDNQDGLKRNTKSLLDEAYKSIDKLNQAQQETVQNNANTTPKYDKDKNKGVDKCGDDILGKTKLVEMVPKPSDNSQKLSVAKEEKVHSPNNKNLKDLNSVGNINIKKKYNDKAKTQSGDTYKLKNVDKTETLSTDQKPKSNMYVLNIPKVDNEAAKRGGSNNFLKSTSTPLLLYRPKGGKKKSNDVLDSTKSDALKKKTHDSNKIIEKIVEPINTAPENIGVTGTVNASKADNKIDKNEKSKAKDLLSKADDITKTGSLKSNSIIALNIPKLFNKLDGVQKNQENELKSSRSDLNNRSSVQKDQKVDLNPVKSINIKDNTSFKVTKPASAVTDTTSSVHKHLKEKVDATNSVQKDQEVNLDPIKSNSIKDNTSFNVTKPASAVTDTTSSVQKHLKEKMDATNSVQKDQKVNLNPIKSNSLKGNTGFSITKPASAVTDTTSSVQKHLKGKVDAINSLQKDQKVNLDPIKSNSIKDNTSFNVTKPASTVTDTTSSVQKHLKGVDAINSVQKDQKVNLDPIKNNSIKGNTSYDVTKSPSALTDTTSSVQKHLKEKMDATNSGQKDQKVNLDSIKSNSIKDNTSFNVTKPASAVTDTISSVQKHLKGVDAINSVQKDQKVNLDPIKNNSIKDNTSYNVTKSPSALTDTTSSVQKHLKEKMDATSSVQKDQKVNLDSIKSNSIKDNTSFNVTKPASVVTDTTSSVQKHLKGKMDATNSIQKDQKVNLDPKKSNSIKDNTSYNVTKLASAVTDSGSVQKHLEGKVEAANSVQKDQKVNLDPIKSNSIKENTSFNVTKPASAVTDTTSSVQKHLKGKLDATNSVQKDQKVNLDPIKSISIKENNSFNVTKPASAVTDTTISVQKHLKGKVDATNSVQKDQKANLDPIKNNSIKENTSFNVTKPASAVTDTTSSVQKHLKGKVDATNSVQKDQKVNLDPIKNNSIKDNTSFNVTKPASAITDTTSSVQKHLKGKEDATNSVQKDQKVNLDPIKSNSIQDNTIFNVTKPASVVTDTTSSVQKHLKGKVDSGENKPVFKSVSATKIVQNRNAEKKPLKSKSVHESNLSNNKHILGNSNLECKNENKSANQPKRRSKSAQEKGALKDDKVRRNDDDLKRSAIVKNDPLIIQNGEKVNKLAETSKIKQENICAKDGKNDGILKTGKSNDAIKEPKEKSETIQNKYFKGIHKTIRKVITRKNDKTITDSNDESKSVEKKVIDKGKNSSYQVIMNRGKKDMEEAKDGPDKQLQSRLDQGSNLKTPIRAEAVQENIKNAADEMVKCNILKEKCVVPQKITIVDEGAKEMSHEKLDSYHKIVAEENRKALPKNSQETVSNTADAIKPVPKSAAPKFRPIPRKLPYLTELEMKEQRRRREAARKKQMARQLEQSASKQKEKSKKDEIEKMNSAAKFILEKKENTEWEEMYKGPKRQKMYEKDAKVSKPSTGNAPWGAELKEEAPNKEEKPNTSSSSNITAATPITDKDKPISKSEFLQNTLKQQSKKINDKNTQENSDKLMSKSDFLIPKKNDVRDVDLNYKTNKESTLLVHDLTYKNRKDKNIQENASKFKSKSEFLITKKTDVSDEVLDYKINKMATLLVDDLNHTNIKDKDIPENANKLMFKSDFFTTKKTDTSKEILDNKINNTVALTHNSTKENPLEKNRDPKKQSDNMLLSTKVHSEKESNKAVNLETTNILRTKKEENKNKKTIKITKERFKINGKTLETSKSKRENGMSLLKQEKLLEPLEKKGKFKLFSKEGDTMKSKELKETKKRPITIKKVNQGTKKESINVTKAVSFQEVSKINDNSFGIQDSSIGELAENIKTTKSELKTSKKQEIQYPEPKENWEKTTIKTSISIQEGLDVNKNRCRIYCKCPKLSDFDLTQDTTRKGDNEMKTQGKTTSYEDPFLKHELRKIEIDKMIAEKRKNKMMRRLRPQHLYISNVLDKTTTEKPDSKNSTNKSDSGLKTIYAKSPNANQKRNLNLDSTSSVNNSSREKSNVTKPPSVTRTNVFDFNTDDSYLVLESLKEYAVQIIQTSSSELLLNRLE